MLPWRFILIPILKGHFSEKKIVSQYASTTMYSVLTNEYFT